MAWLCYFQGDGTQTFLAHQSQRGAYRIDKGQPSVSSVFPKLRGWLKPNCTWSLHEVGRTKVCKVWVTWPRWPPHPYMVKIFWKLLKNQMAILNLGMQHWWLGPYQICSNDELWHWPILQEGHSNSITKAFVWAKANQVIFFENIAAYDSWIVQSANWTFINTKVKVIYWPWS